MNQAEFLQEVKASIQNLEHRINTVVEKSVCYSELNYPFHDEIVRPMTVVSAGYRWFISLYQPGDILPFDKIGNLYARIEDVAETNIEEAILHYAEILRERPNGILTAQDKEIMQPLKIFSEGVLPAFNEFKNQTYFLDLKFDPFIF